MSAQSVKDNHQSQLSKQISRYQRQNNRQATFVQGIRPESVQKKTELNIRTLSNQKHKTFAAIDSSNKPKYSLANNEERKVLLLLGLAQEFIEKYESKKFSQQQLQIKRRNDRKKKLNLKQQSQYKIIQPKNSNYEQQETYQFFINIRNSIKEIYRRKFISDIKDSNEKIDKILGKEENSGREKSGQKKHSQQQKEGKEFMNSSPSTFITCNIDHQSSLHLQDIDLMGVSHFTSDISQMDRSENHQYKQKFHALKSKPSHSRLRIHPVANRFESRKKQQIRLFMQLNEKTEHLQNFRSEEGKFFKLNQNLKITVKNVNLCRMVLLGKKSAVFQQLDRLGGQGYFEEQNNKMKKIKTPDNSTDNCRLTQTKSSFNNTKQSNALDAFREKAIRMMGYFQETMGHFSRIQQFVLQFINKDKSYENYLKQNSIKLKLKAHQKLSQKQLFYNDFLDQCFHVSEISRIYFNRLNQLANQNHSIKEFKILNKQQLDRMVKTVIELRYVLIYLQKQCENTTDSCLCFSFISEQDDQTQYSPTDFAQTLSTSQDHFYRQSHSLSKSKMMSLGFKKAANFQSLMKQTLNLQGIDETKQEKQLKKRSKMQMSSIMIRTINKVSSPLLNRTPSEIIGGSLQRKINNKKSNLSGKQQQLDMNEIWKTFYNKKFSSNAMRLRLY